MAFHPIYTLLVLVVTSSVLLRLLRYFRDPEQRLPGPLAARFSKLWYFRHLYAGNFHETNLALHRNHGEHPPARPRTLLMCIMTDGQVGKIVRLAPNTYSIDDPGATKTLYGPGTRFIKADWYSVWGPPSILEWNLFALQDPKQHAGLRRKYANFYSMSTLVEYEDYIDEVVDVFCHKLDDFAADRSVINFGHWLQCYAFDVIAKITVREPGGVPCISTHYVIPVRRAIRVPKRRGRCWQYYEKSRAVWSLQHADGRISLDLPIDISSRIQAVK